MTIYSGGKSNLSYNCLSWGMVVITTHTTALTSMQEITCHKFSLYLHGCHGQSVTKVLSVCPVCRNVFRPTLQQRRISLTDPPPDPPLPKMEFSEV